MRLDERGVEVSLYWRVARECGGFGFKTRPFDRGYRDWLNHHTAKTQTVSFLAALHPLYFKGHVELGRGVAIGQLTDDEVSACLKMGAIESVFAGTGHAMVSSRAAVEDAMARTMRASR